MAEYKIHSSAHISDSAVIRGEQVDIGPGSQIDDGVVIRATNVKIGAGAQIHKNVELGAEHSRQDSTITIGDETIIHREVRATVPVLEVGDYGSVHEKVVFYGSKGCRIGHNCWIGQSTVLNTKDNLIIGNNFRVGVQSQIWTHVASGELIEGCKIYNVAPTIIEDDVWLVGHVIVSPGIRIARRSIVLPGAVLTKDTEPGRCYAGIPTQDITEKYNPYSKVTREDRFRMMGEWITTFLAAHPDSKGDVFLVKTVTESLPNRNQVTFTTGLTPELSTQCEGTIFDIESKYYTKRRSKIEIDLIKFLMGHKARFVPLDNEIKCAGG